MRSFENQDAFDVPRLKPIYPNINKKQRQRSSNKPQHRDSGSKRNFCWGQKLNAIAGSLID